LLARILTIGTSDFLSLDSNTAKTITTSQRSRAISLLLNIACMSVQTVIGCFQLFHFIISLSSVGNKTGSICFSGMALRVGKNQMCLFVLCCKMAEALRWQAFKITNHRGLENAH
jgi:hypothetical protein